MSWPRVLARCVPLQPGVGHIAVASLVATAPPTATAGAAYSVLGKLTQPGSAEQPRAGARGVRTAQTHSPPRPRAGARGGQPPRPTPRRDREPAGSVRQPPSPTPGQYREPACAPP